MNNQVTVLAPSDESDLVSWVRQAEHQLIVIAPSLSDVMAAAVAERWETLGPENLIVFLDDDPEHIRSGLGTLTAMKLLHDLAVQLNTAVFRMPNSGLTVIVSDDHTIVAPSLTQVLSSQSNKPGGLLINQALLTLKTLTQDRNGTSTVQDKEVERISAENISRCEEDLKRNPPQPDPKVEMIRVFKTQFEFVELELLGTAMELKTARIPPELLGLADNEELQHRMRASFRLIQESDHTALSGKELMAFKKKIADECLIPIKGYGTVVLHTNKDLLNKRVRELQERVQKHKDQVLASLQAAIERSRKELTAALLPAVKRRPLKKWRKFGPSLNDSTLERLLDDELNDAFGSADRLIDDMKVKATYKGVTAELMADPEFHDAATRAIPTLPTLFEAFDAARPLHSDENPES